MFFSIYQYCLLKNCQPLRVLLPHTYCLNRKRTSQSASIKEEIYSEEGGTTLEAAIILPVLLCVFLGILLWGKVFLVHQEIETALLETARQVARQEAILTMQGQEGTGILGASVLFSENRKQGGKTGGIEVSNVKLLHSKYRKSTKEVYLQAEYTIKIPTLLLGTWKLPLKTSVVQKAWNGYTQEAMEGAGTEYVYITEHGRSYHKDSQCYHLHVTIEEVANPNQYYSGQTSYRPCEFCVLGEQDSNILYISEDGECYHEDLSCGGLTRTVKYVEISQAGGRSPCSDCCGGG